MSDPLPGNDPTGNGLAALRGASGGAFFDVDHTLIPGTSFELLLARALLRGDLPGRFRILPFLIEGARLLPRGLTQARKANKAYLRGATAAEVAGWAERIFAGRIAPILSPAADGWIDRERAGGRSIVLLTGMPDLLLGPLVARYRADLVIGTPLAVDSAKRLTGRRAGPHPYGRRKLSIAQDLARRAGWDPAACSAYGDHRSDRHLLAWAGQAYAVDPDRSLRREALRRGWTILSHAPVAAAD